MGNIIELPENLANQIAAGEVVERPASVVKELVENAIDAGATQIDVLVEESGLRKIQVIDNGVGILKVDVKNAFKRHATSKIHGRDDLFRIRTLGFRGEALPSIASVSRVNLETANEADETGTFLKLVGGKIEEEKPAAIKIGTSIMVEDLFFNTPARLKYVKSLQTELAKIGDIVNRLALSHPHIAFRLTSDGNDMVKTVGNGDLKQAIAGIYGVQTAKKMVEISNHDLDFTISGYVSLPEVTRASREYMSIIINGRYIKNFILNKAIVSGYRSKLMVGRYPIAVIEIKTDPLLVDVNVHPTKQEVRLSKEKELTALISSAIFESLQKEQLIPDALSQIKFKPHDAVLPTPPVQQTKFDFSNPFGDNSGETVDNSTSYPHSGEKLKFDENSGEFYLSEPVKSNSLSISVDNVDNFVDNSGKTDELPPDLSTDEPVYDEQLVEDEDANHPEFDLQESSTRKAFAQAQNYLAQEPAPEKRFPELAFFGQMQGTFLFAQSDLGLYVIDQHAAQERIKYEYYREEIGRVSDNLQELLIPIVLEYPISDYLKIKEQLDVLADIGIHLEDFGNQSFLVRMHPTWITAGREEKTIRELIDMLLVEGKVTVAKYRAATAIMMSCKRSIKANHHLDDRQARQLLVDLAKCENPFNCPHGRPVLIHFSNTDLEKMFKRIQDPH